MNVMPLALRAQSYGALAAPYTQAFHMLYACMGDNTKL